MSEVPCLTYMALYIFSFHILQSNSRTSTLWKLNIEEGKIVEASPFPRIVSLPGVNKEHVTDNDQIFNIITSTIHYGKTWTKQDIEYYCSDCQSMHFNANDRLGSTSMESGSNKTNLIPNGWNSKPVSQESSNEASRESDEYLDCGKSVNFTYYDNLVGVANRHNHPHVPEPQVAMIFKKKGSKNTDFDVNALERKLKKAKREKPKSVQLYNQIGNFWRIKGDAQKSIECFRRALAVSPHNAEVTFLHYQPDNNWVSMVLDGADGDASSGVSSSSNRHQKKHHHLHHQAPWKPSYCPIDNGGKLPLKCVPEKYVVLLNLARVLFNLQYLDDAIYLTRRSLEVQPPDKNAWQQYFTLGEIFKAYGHYQEASLHLRHALELKPEFEPALAALKDMESIPDTTIHIYTLLIIICLVLGVLLVILSSVDGNLESEFSEVKTQRHFNRAMAMRSLKMGISPRALRAKRYGGISGGGGSCG